MEGGGETYRREQMARLKDGGGWRHTDENKWRGSRMRHDQATGIHRLLDSQGFLANPVFQAQDAGALFQIYLLSTIEPLL